MTREEALAQFTGVEVEDVLPGFTDNIFEVDSEEYYVLTDDEADNVATNYILDSLWAFRPEFIIEHSELPYEAEEMVRGFQEAKCEGANETIRALINVDDFVSDAIRLDGRGHFIATYDDVEHKCNEFFIYRLN